MTTEMDSEIPSYQPLSTIMATTESTVIDTQYVAKSDITILRVVRMRMANAKISEMMIPCRAD